MFGPEFLVAVVGIVLADLVLAGDNAVVIALAARNLPPDMRRRAVFWGAAVAIGLRAVLTIVALLILSQQLPWVQLVGGVLLLWIAWRLAIEEEDDHEGIDAATTIRGAIQTILVADVVMSVDNVVTVAAIARQTVDSMTLQIALVVFGLALSIPIVMGGATILLRIIDRFPVIVWIGAALIAYVGVKLMLIDPVSKDVVYSVLPSSLLQHGVAAGLAIVLTGIAWMVRARRRPVAERS